VTLNDLIAIQTVAACRELGLRIPEDIAIVSFDDDHSASLMTPTLTTVRQHAYEMGARAAASLLDMVSGEPVQQQVVLPVELVVRQSCGAGS
jgi:DNA-binding LacI/PurR family transcriptional regulator